MEATQASKQRSMLKTRTVFYLSVVVCLLCLTDGSTAEAQSVTANTKYGEIKGSVVSYANSNGRVKSLKTFVGVPYASPPLGKLRFVPPRPPKSWSPRIYEATRYGNVCLQDTSKRILSSIKTLIPGIADPAAMLSEDCLYLNIVEPGEPPISDKYPVMVYIPGQDYSSGTSLDSLGHALALKEVVVVSIQYRLGPFGFLTSEKGESVQGNQGLLDQVQALKWVKENIENFNGDPSQVTIFGHGAGGSSVALHIISPLSKGLFHNAISMSGAALVPWATCGKDSLISNTNALAHNVGCQSPDMVTCLQSVDPWLILNASKTLHLNRTQQISDFNFRWCPVVDGRFLPEEPIALLRTGRFARVPYIAGLAANEYADLLKSNLRRLYGITQLTHGINASIFGHFTQRFAQNIQPSKRYGGLLADAMGFEYYPWPRYPAHNINPGLLQKAIDFGSDFYFSAPVQSALIMHNVFARTYMYVFDHCSAAESWRGAAHADDLRFLFRNSTQASHKEELDISQAMVTLWTNFAKYGNPTPFGPVYGSLWNEFNRSDQVYLSIGGPKGVLSMGKNYHGSRTAFWNYFYPKLMNESPECEVMPQENNGDKAVLSKVYFAMMCSIPFLTRFT